MIFSYKGRSKSKLQTQKYVPGQTINFRIPKGHLISNFMVKLVGYFTPTFTSGSPALHRYGVMDALLPEVSIKRSPTDTHKIVSPKWMRDQQRLFSGKDSLKLTVVNSTSINSQAPTQAYAAFGSTGQPVAVAESISIPMEHLFSSQQLSTLFDARKSEEALVSIKCNPVERLQQDGGAVVITYTHDLTIEVSYETVEDPNLVGSQDGFFSWQQFSDQYSFSAQAQKFPIALLQRNTWLTGLWIEAFRGADKNVLTFAEMEETVIALRENNRSDIAEFTLAELYSETLSRTPYDNALSLGGGYINLLSASDFLSGRFIGDDVNDIDLYVTTPSGISYSPNPLILNIKKDFIADLDPTDKRSFA